MGSTPSKLSVDMLDDVPEEEGIVANTVDPGQVSPSTLLGCQQITAHASCRQDVLQESITRTLFSNLSKRE